MKTVTLAEIVKFLGGTVIGDSAVVIKRIIGLDEAGAGDISFLSNPKYRLKLKETKAAAVIVTEEVAVGLTIPCIVTEQPYLYFARLSQWLHTAEPRAPGVHPSAVVESAIPSSVFVGANAWIGKDVNVGEQVVIEPGCHVGNGVSIGTGSVLHSGVTIYSECCIGERAIIHAGTVIGADGFGFARDTDGAWIKIPQVGAVRIGNDVEVGANTTIDRGALGDTVIEDGVKLDNQIQIAHNVHIGAHTAIAGCVGIAGSAVIGKRCMIGGGAIILGHITLADDVFVSAGTVIGKSIPKPGNYTGTPPFLPHDDWLHNFARIRHLDTMADKIRALEARLDNLEKSA